MHLLGEIMGFEETAREHLNETTWSQLAVNAVIASKVHIADPLDFSVP